MKLNKIKVGKTLKNFQKSKVLVIGDLILDEFIWGNVDRISPEAPVPVVWVKSESFMPGGASNVANNISSLGGKATILGVIGDDHHGKLLTDELKRRNVDTSGLVIDNNRPTSLKTRIIAHHQQVVRVDREKIDNIDDNLIEQILSFVRQKINDIDGLIIEDYGKGLITPRLLSEIIPLARKHNKIITVDPKENHFSFYRQVTSITPNTKEAALGAGIKIHSSGDIDRIGKKLLKDLELESVLITLGEEGMRLFEKNGQITHINTAAQEVFDVSGAGDTVIAVFTLALCSGASTIEAAGIANISAGIVVGKVGVAVVTKEEIIERLKIK
ncbi:MAG: D-glycero-beta-D-manno-heptose-7-phosphate kinase [Candidatus Omnitrophota bacterium]